LGHVYKKAHASIWTAEETDLSSVDRSLFQKLSADAQHVLSHVLIFFTTAEIIVDKNPFLNFASAVQSPEAQCLFYGLQIAIDNVHTTETYSLLSATLVTPAVQADPLHES
jgi:ribonucleotide reductase beta subunit family protein with ferritin-like domain